MISVICRAIWRHKGTLLHGRNVTTRNICEACGKFISSLLIVHDCTQKTSRGDIYLEYWQDGLTIAKPSYSTNYISKHLPGRWAEEWSVTMACEYLAHGVFILPQWLLSRSQTIGSRKLPFEQTKAMYLRILWYPVSHPLTRGQFDINTCYFAKDTRILR